MKNTNQKLSLRELELLQFAANGYSNKQIAEAIHLSVYTIDTRNRSIIEKLNAKNMKEAIAIGIRNKWIE
ncbi:MAG: LuxR C-terminal-related transcriptional regulator [Chitinophagales bacterium]